MGAERGRIAERVEEDKTVALEARVRVAHVGDPVLVEVDVLQPDGLGVGPT